MPGDAPAPVILDDIVSAEPQPAVQEQQPVFSATLSSPDGTQLIVDPSILPPDKEKMNVKQFLAGLLLPVFLVIGFTVTMIASDGMAGDSEMHTLTADADGNFTIDFPAYEIDCDSKDWEIRLSWEDAGEYRDLWFSCWDRDAVMHERMVVGLLSSSGEVELNLLYPPKAGEKVILSYWDGDADKQERLGTGDGNETSFNGSIDTNRCHAWMNYDYIDSSGKSRETYVDSFQKGNSCTFSMDREMIIIEDIDFNRPVTFNLNGSGGEPETIKMEISSWDYSGEGLEAIASLLCCLIFIGGGIGAYFMGFKWFSYGVGASILVTPVIFFVTCFATLIAFGF